jgi:formiminotetrahydrofolate cyclodeaminase
MNISLTKKEYQQAEQIWEDIITKKNKLQMALNELEKQAEQFGKTRIGYNYIELSSI